MTFAEFEQRAAEEWERIPEEYRAGVDGLVVERAAQPHASLPDVYTLGECLTESYPSEFGGPDTTRSTVVLYYGSFFRLSRLDATFDWEAELWETLTHELQHHLESLAADDALADMDYAADENHKRYEGQPFDPYFFRHGLPENGWFRIEDEYYLEVEPPHDGVITFEWRGTPYRVTLPAGAADVTLLTVSDGVPDAPRALHIAVIRSSGLLAGLGRLLRGRQPVLAEYDVVATPG